MATLKSQKQTYEFSLDEMKKLICIDLKVPVNAVTVSYKMQDTSDDRFGGGSNYQVCAVEVVVDQAMISCNSDDGYRYYG